MTERARSRPPYATAAYAATLAHIGEPVDVVPWGTHVLLRPIPGSDRFDVTGTYPLTCFAGDADLAAGLDVLRRLGAVSAVLVPDPFRAPSKQALEALFDRVTPFKTHHVADFTLGLPVLGASHRRQVRLGQRRCRVRIASFSEIAPFWRSWYAHLIRRHEISGAAAHPPAAFERYEQLPGLTTFLAEVDGQPAAAALYLEHLGIVDLHLAAGDAASRDARAHFAITALALEHFADRRLLNFGGGAGVRNTSDDGLSAFKRGFSNSTARTLLVGAILDPAAYARLSSSGAESDYFPAYRAPLGHGSRQLET